jgi:hypothetical protein
MTERDINLNEPASVIAGLTELRDLDGFTPGSLAVVLADHNARGICVVLIDEVPADPPQDERVEVLACLIGATRSHGLDDAISGFLVAHERTGSGDVRGHDLAWRDAATVVAKDAGLVLYGNYMVTSDGVARVIAPELAAQSST